MATIEPIVGGGQPCIDGNGGYLTPFEWMVDSLTPEDDPTAQPGIYSRGDVVVKWGRRFVCDSVTAEYINDTCSKVTAKFSTDSRFVSLIRPPVPPIEGEFHGFTLGYKKVPISMPVFTLGKHEYTDADGNPTSVPWWIEDESIAPIQLEFGVLNASVRLENLSNHEILQVILQTQKQTGCIHRIDAGLLVWWVMQPASIVEDRPGSLMIHYTWESDPGNASPNLPAATTIVPPYRPGFWSYIVRRAQTPDGKPTIDVTDNFPPEIVGRYDANGDPVYVANPYYQPDGWRTLPGAPL